MRVIAFTDLRSQYLAMQDEIHKEINDTLASCQFIGGEKITALEKNLAEFSGAGHAIACSSGTDALLLALMALDVGSGDEVIVTAFSFWATAEVVALLGARPVFVDIKDSDYNINENKIKEKITDKTRAIIAVSLYGQTPDFEKINAIAKAHGIKVIEDAAQSFGARFKGRRSCNLTDLAATSFFPSKPLGCYGDGGAVFTSDETLAKKIRSLLNHGQERRYEHKYVGLNARLDTIQAGILNVKLRYLEEELQKRREIAEIYTQRLKDYVITPAINADCESVYAQYSIRVPKRRQDLAQRLKDAGIPTAVHYPGGLYKQAAFDYLGEDPASYPVTEAVSKEILSLPFSAYLSVGDQNKVITEIQRALK